MNSITSTIPRTSTNGISALEAAHALTQLVGASFPSVSSHTKEQPKRYVVSEDEASTCTEESKPKKSKRKITSAPPGIKKQVESFPARLMNMLSDLSVRETITWLPHGRSFVVLRPDVFAESILPHYFPESAVGRGASNKAKYPSFTRKLNRWGFRQVNKGPDSGAFHHPLFRRDEPAMCYGMECQKSGKSGIGKKTAANKRVDVEVVAEEAAAPRPSPHRVPLKKRKLSHLPASTSFAVAPATTVASVSSSSLTSVFTASLSTASFSSLLSPLSSSSVSSLSETPLLPVATPLARMPRRVSSLSDTTLPTRNQEWHHMPHGPSHDADASFDATLRRLQASMEKARAAKKFFSAHLDVRAQQPQRGAVPIQPRPADPDQAKRNVTAEEHKSMLYKAFLQAMHR
mmetsp:Transcript_46702/g.141490  ORF Transcript_46702/g.141490 Transcript_46702/m.141490 type:complete len:403 (-) Transcript_46702:212-1420(-)